MNIAMFSDTYVPHKNGVVSAILLEKSELEKRGHTVYIISVGTVQKDDADSVIRMRSVPAPLLKSKQPFRIGIYDRTKIKKFFQTYEIDIVHTHTEFSVGWIGYHLARKYHIPHIHTFHTMWEDYKNVYFLTRVIVPFNLVRTAMRRFLTYPNLITTPTQKAADYIAKLVPDSTITILQNGIPFTPLQNTDRNLLRAKFNLPTNAIIALFTGRISDEKRILQLYRVYKLAMLHNSSLYLLLAGDGGRLKELQKTIQEDGLEERVRSLGFVSLEVVNELNALADITTTASLSETSNMSLLEGISSGLAVIARNDLCLSGVVEDYVNGVLCKDELEMVEQLLYLCENPKILDTYRRNNLQLASQFTAQKHTDTLLNLYEETLELLI